MDEIQAMRSIETVYRRMRGSEVTGLARIRQLANVRVAEIVAKVEDPEARERVERWVASRFRGTIVGIVRPAILEDDGMDGGAA